MSTTEEKFARAVRTSHLKLGREEEAPRDAERIWAAGASQTRHDGEAHKDAQERSLGVLLTRLRIEWDGTSKQDREQAAKDLTARVLLLINLRSLAPVKQAMLNFALAKAEGKGCGNFEAKAAQAEVWWSEGILSKPLTDEDRIGAIEDHAVAVRALSDAAAKHQANIATLVGQVLDAWLDKNCVKCAGRGFTGGYGTAKVMCPKQGGCGGAGSKRQGKFGKTKAEHFFSLWLLNTMDSKVNGSMGQMARKVRSE